MPRYESNPSAVQSSIEVLPKDDYEFVVGEPKAFERTGAKGVNYGVRYGLTVGSGDYNGKRTVVTLYEHTEGAQSMAKRFKMAALGYAGGRAEEKRFDAEWGGKDWSFDTDSGSVGDAWRELVGQRVVGSLDVRMDDNGNENQDFKGWRPLGK